MSAQAQTAFAPPTQHAAVRLAASASAEHLKTVRATAAARALPRIWEETDMSVRIVLVMLASGQPGAAERIARQPWGSFSEADQIAMASAARLVVASLSGLAALA